jgi:hypothetical protein
MTKTTMITTMAMSPIAANRITHPSVFPLISRSTTAMTGRLSLMISVKTPGGRRALPDVPGELTRLPVEDAVMLSGLLLQE